jgi:hypothetical protein
MGDEVDEEQAATLAATDRVPKSVESLFMTVPDLRGG